MAEQALTRATIRRLLYTAIEARRAGPQSVAIRCLISRSISDGHRSAISQEAMPEQPYFIWYRARPAAA